MKNFNNEDKFPIRYRVVAITDSILNDGYEYAIMLNNNNEYIILKSWIEADGSTNLEVSGAEEYNRIASLIADKGDKNIGEEHMEVINPID